MNGSNPSPTPPHNASRMSKPPPLGPAPATAPPPPPTHPITHASQPPLPRSSLPPHNHPPAPNGHHTHSNKPKKRTDVPVDPATMYESLKNRIAALEEEEVLEEEEERRTAEEAQKSVKGMEENAIHAKYIELFAELKRVERDHAKEKQKLVKDKDAAKSQLTKANQTKTKIENLARELQKDNKRLREDGKRLAQSFEDVNEELKHLKSDLAKRGDKAKAQEVSPDMQEIVVKVVCRYRAELFFRISRKTKFSRLFDAWTDRMERGGGKEDVSKGNGSAKIDAASTAGTSSSTSTMQFVFTHRGRSLDPELTPDDVGIKEADEILAVELMDLTEGNGSVEWEEHVEPRREKLKKTWTEDPREAKKTIEEIFDSVVRERLKDLLRQYELRERQFECIIRSKELEVILARARSAQQRHIAEIEKTRAEKLEEENQKLSGDLEDAKDGQLLIDKLIMCYKEPSAEGTQRMFASLREELERKQPRAIRTI